MYCYLKKALTNKMLINLDNKYNYFKVNMR